MIEFSGEYFNNWPDIIFTEEILMNPFALLGIMKRFESAHPKAAAFVRNELMTGLPEGTIIEMTVTKPGAESRTSNIRITQDDLEALNEIRSMGTQQ